MRMKGTLIGNHFFLWYIHSSFDSFKAFEIFSGNPKYYYLTYIKLKQM